HGEAEVAAGDGPGAHVPGQGRGRHHPDRTGGPIVKTAETAPTLQTATLEVRGLHAQVEGKEILKGIDLVVPQGEVHAIMGPNGSGKSTLANVIMGRPSYRVTEGEVRFKEIGRASCRERVEIGVGGGGVEEEDR